MDKHIEIMKQINQVIVKITESLNKLTTIRNKATDKIVVKALNDYILLVAYINYKFIMYLVSITSKNTQKNYINTEFNKIMKDLFKNGK